MNEQLKESLLIHLQDLLHFWWNEYDAFKRMGENEDDRASAAAAAKNYRHVMRDYRALEAV